MKGRLWRKWFGPAKQARMTLVWLGMCAWPLVVMWLGLPSNAAIIGLAIGLVLVLVVGSL